MQLPQHLAIIMDGNGRWAQKRGHSRIYGHVRGARVAKNMIEECCRLGVKHLTLFAFSTENWLRPQAEVSFLMRLLRRQLRKERQSLIDNNIRFRCIGDISRLPQPVQSEISLALKETRGCTGMNLVFALSYGGRQELTHAVQRLAQDIQDGYLKADSIDENIIESYMESSFLPNPDLIIRTSGESRLSNFYLWQAAYSEFVVTEKYWPEFTRHDLISAIHEYSSRERRFGQTTRQIKKDSADFAVLR